MSIYFCSFLVLQLDLFTTFYFADMMVSIPTKRLETVVMLGKVKASGTTLMSAGNILESVMLTMMQFGTIYCYLLFMSLGPK